ncbi:MAG: hypothetical protein ACJA2O_004605, partial [Candidatus Azotimanducaceae bacterium]
MKNLLKYFGYACLTGVAVVSLFMVNLFLMKPFSIDQFLAKELVVGLVGSPETMTYLGVFDDFNAVLKHNQKLTIPSLQESEEHHADQIKVLRTLKKYDAAKLTDIQKITQKIAIFDIENDINEFDNFRYHSYPFNQISGGHLNLVEFMTDMHPVRNDREAADYIKRVKLFDEVFAGDLLWLAKQKEQGIFAPKFVFD